MAQNTQVGDHEVPVFLRDPELLKSLDWDLALRQVIPHIDGVKYARRIAMDAEVNRWRSGCTHVCMCARCHTWSLAR